MQIPLGVEPRFAPVVRKLEKWAAVHRRSYLLAVLLLALSGYAYLVSLLLLMIAAAGALVAVRLPLLFINPGLVLCVIAPFLVLAGIILGALWVKIQPPTGFEVTRKSAPVLFTLLDGVGRAARAPPIHRVLIVPEFNAAVAAIPRLGVFGWSTNYLMIGLPLMQSVSESEFTAIMAHEYGHLAGKHGWFRSWVYRLRMAWVRIALALQGRAGWSRWFFVPFYALYVPYFNAYSFVLARADEYQADRMAAEIAGSNAAATALTRVYVVGHYLSARFWPNLYKATNTHADPPYLPLARLQEELSKPLPVLDAVDGFNLALAHTTDLSDTHPALPDRLKAMGVVAAPAGALAVSAADVLLDAKLRSKIIDVLDSKWRWLNRENWNDHYQRSRDDRRLLSDLEEKAEQESLNPAECLARAKLTEQLLGDEQAVALYRESVKADPQSAQAQFDLGRLLIYRNDTEGLALIEAAMAADDRLTMAGCELAYLQRMRAGCGLEAEAYRVRLTDQRELEQRAAEERTAPRRHDRYVPHGLDQERLSPIVAGLRACGEVRRAYLMRRQVSVLPHRPYYILLVKVESSPDSIGYELAQRLDHACEFPGDTRIVPLTWKFRWLLRRCRRMPGVLIVSKR